MTEMTARFQRCRWGVVRKIMDQIPVGGYAAFALTRNYTVTTTARRLEHAYGDRKYHVRRVGEYYKVERVK